MKMEPSQLQYQVPIADRLYKEITVKREERATEIKLKGIFPKINSQTELDIFLQTETLSNSDTVGIAVPVTAASAILSGVQAKGEIR